ncbi:hypothetical protein E3N88_24961 [Mikania micrantha]|uniref:Uncharacterized protein n=1 Tax=Mikania micrantha TaxID=192012 RepID=A0A5N6N4P0_9ASTR|nr:hypothetical protein E3N88_24961 [Mikania micrantha]
MLKAKLGLEGTDRRPLSACHRVTFIVRTWRSRLLVSQCLPYSDSSMSTHVVNLNIMLKLLAILEWTNCPLSACQGVFFVARTIVDQTVWPLSACQKGVLHSQDSEE